MVTQESIAHKLHCVDVKYQSSLEQFKDDPERLLGTQIKINLNKMEILKEFKMVETI